MKQRYFFAFLIFLSIRSMAQQPILQQGKLQAENQKPIANATINVFSVAHQLLLKATTDDSGLFAFAKPLQQFYVSISCIGYTTLRLDELKNLQIITLKATETQLKEVSVNGSKPFIDQQFDKLIVNVNGDDKMGMNAIDILKKVPGIVLRNNKDLTLEGKAITILIDGKPTRLSGANLLLLLEGMPTANLNQLEIMHNPSAKYDAAGAGGLINIKTIKREKAGYDANISLMGGHGWKYPLGSSTLGLNYKTGNSNFYGSYSYGLGKQYQEIQTNSFLNELNQRLRDSSIYRSGYTSNNIRLGLEHALANKDVLGVLFTGYFNTRNPNYYANTATYNLSQALATDRVNSVSNNETQGRGVNVNLNFRHVIDTKKQEELTVDADAGIFDYQNSNNNTVTPSVSNQRELYLQDGYAKTQILSLKSDYAKKWVRGLFESGIKLSHVNIENNFNSLYGVNAQAPVDNGSNDFTYQESILAAYASQRLAFGKFSMLLGLRGEQTFTTGNSITLGSEVNRQYLNLFPNATLGLKLNKNILSLAYSRRIGRPLYNELNPFVLVLNAFATRSGNPNLNPSYTDNLRLSFTLNNKLTLSSAYGFASNVITDLKTRDPQQQVTNSFKTNLSTYQNIGFGISYNDKFFKKLRLNYSAGASHSDYQFFYNGATENVYQTTASLSLGNTIDVSPTFWVELFFYGQSRVTYGNSINLPFSTTSLSLGKKIWKGKGSLAMNINDIFYTGITRNEADYGNIVYNLKSKYDSRNVRLNFSYRFGNSKIEVKRRSSGSEEEQRRTQ